MRSFIYKLDLVPVSHVKAVNLNNLLHLYCHKDDGEICGFIDILPPIFGWIVIKSGPS